MKLAAAEDNDEASFLLGLRAASVGRAAKHESFEEFKKIMARWSRGSGKPELAEIHSRVFGENMPATHSSES
jgi:hypothetical protein